MPSFPEDRVATFTSPPPARQDADGTPHLVLNHPTSSYMLTFTWDGSSPFVSVAMEGYGETPYGRFTLPDRAHNAGFSPPEILRLFQAECLDYVQNFEDIMRKVGEINAR